MEAMHDISTDSPNAAATSSAAIMNVSRLVEQHLAGNWTLNRMARMADMSVTHFSRVFSRLYGEPPMAWLARLRLEYAAIWLKSNQTSIVDVARVCGYESREGFVRAFKRCFGRSPQTFRQQARRRHAQLYHSAALRNAALPVHLVDRPSEQAACVRHIGSYRQASKAWNRLRAWARRSNRLTADARCIWSIYEEPVVTAARNQRSDIGLITPPGDDWPDYLFTLNIDAGLFARADFQGSFNQLKQTWYWFYYIWLPDNCSCTRGLPFFDEQPAFPLLAKPLTWSRLQQHHFNCQLFIPIASHHGEGCIPVEPPPKINGKNGHTNASRV